MPAWCATFQHLDGTSPDDKSINDMQGWEKSEHKWNESE